mgnify:CR=1 FL=1
MSGANAYLRAMTLHIAFDNSYARLPDALYTRVAPTPVKAPHLLAYNDALAAEQLGEATKITPNFAPEEGEEAAAAEAAE